MLALVTGCAGFIGSRLAAALLDARHEVVGVDCFTPYYAREAKEANLAPLLPRRGFRFVEADLREAPLDDLAAVDTVFHLAAQAGVRASWGPSFADYLGHNLLATQRLLEVCVAGDPQPSLVFASSSSIYGDAERHPTPETVPGRPVSPYGTTKLAAESLLEAYRSNFGLRAVALRYFTVYGPGQRPDMAFHRFIRAILLGDAIEVYGDGEQTRDVTYVDDAVRATAAAAALGDADTPINVGGGSQISVNEVIRRLGELTGLPPRVQHRAAATGDVRHTSADLERARTLLGYKPEVGIDDGLREEVGWLRAALG